MILNLGGEDEEDQNRNRKNSVHRPSDSQSHRTRLQRMARQDSWTGFKDKAFRVASTVVLPKHMRTSTKDVRAGATMKSKAISISVKSLPQMKREEDVRAKRKLFAIRSISEEPRSPAFLAITPTEEQEKPFPTYTEESERKKSICLEDEPVFLPKPPPTLSMVEKREAKKVLFVPRNSAIFEETEEEETSPTSRCTKMSLNLPEKSEEFHRDRIAKKRSVLKNKYNDFSTSIRSEEEREIERRGFLETSSYQPYIMVEDLSFGPPEKPKSLAIPFSSFDVERQVQKFSDKTPTDLGEEEYFSEEEEEEESLSYNDYYNCLPPPIFMFFITIVEIGFFIYHGKKLLNNPNYGHIGKYSPAPLDSSLIYNPTRRYEIWRYVTYAFVHSGYMHIINNIAIQLVLGVLLEIVHKWWRVLCIYFAGVIAGSLATSITEPFNYLAGASAGVYALITAHLSTVIMNWKQMEYPWVRVLIVVAFLIHDGGTAVYFAYIVGEKTNVGYSAHLGGAVAGLLVGIHVLKNIQWTPWETKLWYTSIVMCFVLLSFAIVWNIVRSDLFP